MRKLLLAIIITILPYVTRAQQPTIVPFITMYGHEDVGPALYIDYPRLYRENEDINHFMVKCAGHSVRQQEIENKLVGSIGYYMLKYNSWYVVMGDPDTQQTGEVVKKLLSHRKIIDITDNIEDNWDLDNLGRMNFGHYTILRAGKNLYPLLFYVNEWPLHLLCD